MMKRRQNVFAINWMEVEALVTAKHDNPHHILGIHECLDDVYVNVFIPDAKVVKIADVETGKEYALVSDRVKGFYSVRIKNKSRFDYVVKVKYEDGREETFVDPYIFEPVIDPIDISLFNEGMHYEIYEKLGAHPMNVDGVDGTLFAVWAPNAERVSVVGNFCNWDGRRYQMRKLDYSGIFELFIPGEFEGEIYKYEVASKKDRYLPSKEVFLQYADDDYRDETPAFRALEGYLRKTYDKDLHDFAVDIQNELYKTGDDFDGNRFTEVTDYAVKELENKYGIAMSSLDKLNELIGYLQDMANSTRLWINNGHTTAELNREAVNEHAKKIYPNDPCPCGSGKKYKKCCGRNI